MATAPIRSLAWEPPYATGVALKRQKNLKKKIKFSPALLWLSKLRIAVTTAAWVTVMAWVQSLARELLHAMGTAKKKKKQQQFSLKDYILKLNMME